MRLQKVQCCTVFAGLFLSVLGDVCTSWRSRRVHTPTQPTHPIQVTIQHHFLNVQSGVIPGLQFNVSLWNPTSEAVWFVAWGVAWGPGSTACSHESTAGALPPNGTRTLAATHTAEHPVQLTCDVATQGKEVWYSASYEFPIRHDCYFISPNGNLILTSDELHNHDWKSVLILAPRISGLQINIDAVIDKENDSIMIYNVSESSGAVTLTQTQHIAFVVSEDQFLMADYHKCFGCIFQLTIKEIATKYECNSTLEIPQGSLKLAKLAPCQLYLQALPFHRIILKMFDVTSIKREDCYLQKVIIGPVTENSSRKIWTPCLNASQSTYLSESHSLNVSWTRPLDGIELHYEFLLPCANRSYGERALGHFCSTGYPDVVFGCPQAYSITAPPGSGLSVRVVTRGLRRGPDGVLRVTAEDHREEWTDGGAVTVRVEAAGREVLHRGFCALYHAIPCLPGWASAGDRFCYKVYGEKLSWQDAEEICRQNQGHLVTILDIRRERWIHQLIQNSSMYKQNHAFWIGANDLKYENFYEWADGQPFDFSNWFPGWDGIYSVQPNDDGLSQQNCVELRNVFRYPGQGHGTTSSFFWNDRDCQVENPFVCQRLKPGVSTVCNRTIELSREQPHDVLTSPGFPGFYPNNMICHYNISAPKKHRIQLLFTDFALEESESCEYDALTLVDGDLIWQRCGNWDSQIKTLRHISSSHTLSLTFASDLSQSYKGFRIQVSIFVDKSTAKSTCDSEMFQLHKDTCYLVVNYPETNWETARQICSEAKGHLVLVENAEQVTVLDELVRSTYGYMTGVIYWVGAQETNNTWKWLDGSLLNPKHLSSATNVSGSSCLALQWKQLPGANALRWTSKNCQRPGRFICQKPPIVLNRTVNGKCGNLTSLNYPSAYWNDLDYQVAIVGPPRSRVVITFQHLDLEWQEDCLYDYILLRSSPLEEEIRVCGQHIPSEFVSSTNRAYLSFHSDFSVTRSGFSVSWEAVDCGDRVVVRGPPEPFASPRYPLPYPAPIECQVTAVASTRILITVLDMDLASHDCLQINLNPEERNYIQLCEVDFMPGMQLLSYGNEIHLVFRSIHKTRDLPNRGYNLTWEAWSGSPLETTLHVQGPRGRVWGPTGPLAPPLPLNGSLRLEALPGRRLRLRHLTAGHAACTASLVISDPFSSHAPLSFSPCVPFPGVTATQHVLHVYAWNWDDAYALDYDIYERNTTASCHPNPCQHGGRCLENGTCLCLVYYTGFRCDHFAIPYKSLSERMLEEPFWLGLITVFSVLLVILLVYCIKRKFADKIEKFLADEIERSKYQPPASSSPPKCRRIRKDSAPDTPRPWDQMLRRVQSANQPTASCSVEEEKSRILASLVAPPKDSRRMSLDEFFRMSERKMQRKTNEDEKKETSFTKKPFLDIESIPEQPVEYVSSSESINDEPCTSEVHVSPFNLKDPSSSPPSIQIHQSRDTPTEPICDKKPLNRTFPALSPILPRNSSYLEVPQTIPAIQVFSADQNETVGCKHAQKNPENLSPCRVVHARKYSVDLPKILITPNMGDCDEASPPRTPNPSMVYLAVISANRTLSESNLSTSGYSSISSSRCNSTDDRSPKNVFFPEDLDAQFDSSIQSNKTMDDE